MDREVGEKVDLILTQGLTGSQEVPEPSRRCRLPTWVEMQAFSWVRLLLLLLLLPAPSVSCAVQ